MCRHLEANRYEHEGTCVARAGNANTGEGFESAESAKKPAAYMHCSTVCSMDVYYISSPGGRMDGRVYTHRHTHIRRQTGMSRTSSHALRRESPPNGTLPLLCFDLTDPSDPLRGPPPLSGAAIFRFPVSGTGMRIPVSFASNAKLEEKRSSYTLLHNMLYGCLLYKLSGFPAYYLNFPVSLAMFTKRVYFGCQVSFTVPVGPFLCLAIITSATFLSSVSGL